MMRRDYEVLPNTGKRKQRNNKSQIHFCVSNPIVLYFLPDLASLVGHVATSKKGKIDIIYCYCAKRHNGPAHEGFFSYLSFLRIVSHC